MKNKEIEQPDPLEQMREMWQEHCRRMEQMPWLTDEQLDAIYVKCREDAGRQVNGSRWRRSKRSSRQAVERTAHRICGLQIVTVVFCLGLMVAAVLMGAATDDRPIRMLLGVVAALCVLLAMQSLFPRLSPVYHLLTGDVDDGKKGRRVRFCRGHIVPIGISVVLALMQTACVPVGDGYAMLTTELPREEVLDSITFMIVHTA